MGTHISKIKSITLDSWTPEQIQVMVQHGNRKVQEMYNPTNALPPPNASDGEIEYFIRTKYEKRTLANPGARSKNYVEPPTQAELSMYSYQIKTLAGMGFTDQNKCVYALKRAKGALDQAVDILVNMADASASGSPNPAPNTSQSGPSTDAREALMRVLDDAIAKLRAMGFSDSEECKQALRQANGSIEAAANILLDQKRRRSSLNQNAIAAARSVAAAPQMDLFGSIAEHPESGFAGDPFGQATTFQQGPQQQQQFASQQQQQFAPQLPRPTSASHSRQSSRQPYGQQAPQQAQQQYAFAQQASPQQQQQQQLAFQQQQFLQQQAQQQQQLLLQQQAQQQLLQQQQANSGPQALFQQAGDPFSSAAAVQPKSQLNDLESLFAAPASNQTAAPAQGAGADKASIMSLFRANPQQPAASGAFVPSGAQMPINPFGTQATVPQQQNPFATAPVQAQQNPFASPGVGTGGFGGAQQFAQQQNQVPLQPARTGSPFVAAVGANPLQPSPSMVPRSFTSSPSTNSIAMMGGSPADLQQATTAGLANNGRGTFGNPFGNSNVHANAFASLDPLSGRATPQPQQPQPTPPQPSLQSMMKNPFGL
ncbi:uncharacterized protein BJ171DRAFT_600182 [Polychytrium aggregatum]|uniref:uncharacterized protein n=1 Tax=Polychytrium aggregatum TaxID=110093 RepID=UPI0022FF15F6|nr:uncharacterized protein BJ171DRAFT_600182 [Polychytrium aggregatum]KAI9203323.1 hypothetical protein BJ171DRAFT_600182 [Polychytrium aggregatum]